METIKEGRNRQYWNYETIRCHQLLKKGSMQRQDLAETIIKDIGKKEHKPEDATRISRTGSKKAQ